MWSVGRYVDRYPRRTAVAVLGVVTGALLLLGTAWPTLVAVLVATALWNGAFGGVPTMYQALAVRTRAVSPELAGAWINATANAGIAGGAAIGAGLLQAAGLWALPWVGASLVGAGLAVILLLSKIFRPRSTATR